MNDYMYPDVNYNGPFYVQKSDGTYMLSTICKNCAFCSEKDNACCLNPCTYFYSVAEAEKEMREVRDSHA